MAPHESTDDLALAAELEAYVRPYVLALLRIIVAEYERTHRDARLERAMGWERAPMPLAGGR